MYLWVQRLWSSLTSYSPYPALGWIVAFSWLRSTVAEEASAKDRVVFATATVAGAAVLGEYSLFRTLHEAQASLWDIPGIFLLYALGTGAYVALLFWAWKWGGLSGVLRATAVLPLLRVSIGIGGSFKKYLVFLLPALIPLFLSVLRSGKGARATMAALLAVTAFTYRPPTTEYGLLDCLAAASASSKVARSTGRKDAASFHSPVFSSKYRRGARVILLLCGRPHNRSYVVE